MFSKSFGRGSKARNGDPVFVFQDESDLDRMSFPQNKRQQMTPMNRSMPYLPPLSAS